MRKRTKRIELALFLVASACQEARTAGTGASTSVTLARGTIESGGHERSYAFWAPAGDGPFPLVVALHGRLGDGEGQDRLSHFTRVGERERFIVAFPDGYRRSWADARGATPASEAGYDDVAFLGALVSAFVKDHHADPARVYFTGMSNGGFMTATVACALADRVAAIAMVGATVPEGFDAICKPSRPMPAMLVLGDRDPLVPYAGGQVAGRGGENNRAASGEDSARFWATANGCAPTPAVSSLPDTDPDDGTRTTLRKWESCKDGADVWLYTVEGGGHTWPGGWQYFGPRIIGKTARDFDATDAIWSFFKAKHR